MYAPICALYKRCSTSYGRLRPDKDIKHNKLPGVLKREEYFDENSVEISELFRELEEMRPSKVYGTGKNGNTAKKGKIHIFKD